MVISANILVPRAIALAAVGYCVWPSLTVCMSDTESKPPAKLPAVETTLLRPKMPPQPVRDPFQVQVAAKAGSPRKASKAGVGTGHGNATGKPVNPLAGLTLDATCIVGTQRLAVINGRLYAAEETLPTSNSATPPLKIANVLPYKVLFEWEGKILELTYSNITSSLAASHEAGVYVGGPKGVTGGSGTKKPHASRGARSSGKSRVNGAGK